jgi:hypothetical protein
MQHPTFGIQLHPALGPHMVTNDFLGGIDIAGEVVALVMAIAVEHGAITDQLATDLLEGMDKLLQPILAGHAAISTMGQKLN